MTRSSPAPVTVRGLVKDYRGLRPLRIRELALGDGECVCLYGLDAAAAEVLVNLLTGATLPDEGEVRVFDRLTTAIAGGDDWLRLLDRFGIVSDRVVLLDGLTVAQNLAVPFTLDLDPPPEPFASAARRLAGQVGLSDDLLEARAAGVPADARARVRLARAIALDPEVLLLEHPTASLAPASAPGFAADLRRAASARRLAMLAITADARFGRAIGGRQLSLDPASGAVRPLSRWRPW